MNNNLINTNKSLLQATYKDVSVIGQLYTNSIEVDDFTTQSNLATSKNYFIFPNTDLFFNADDMTTLYKNLQQFNNLTLSNLISLSNLFYVHSSYLSTFNNFRADFEDFNFNITDSVRNIFDNNLLQPTSNFKNTQLSNPITIRSNVKNSIVNFNALRKVFRARFDEGRSHTSLQLFANSYLNQPFINDTAINYTQLLSKDTNSFYQNVLYKNTNFKI